MAKTKTFSGDDIIWLRRRLNLNQSQFWNRLGVTQSGGSRYESGRKIPRPVQQLLLIAYGTEKQSSDAVAMLRSKAGA